MHIFRDMAKFRYTIDEVGCRTQDLIQAPQSTSIEAIIKRAAGVKSGRGRRVVVSVWDVGAGNPGSLPVWNANSGIPLKVDYSSLGRRQQSVK